MFRIFLVLILAVGSAAAVLGQVDVMPRRRTPAEARIVAAQLGGPIGDAGERGVGFAAQQCAPDAVAAEFDKLLRALVREHGHDPVGAAA